MYTELTVSIYGVVKMSGFVLSGISNEDIKKLDKAVSKEIGESSPSKVLGMADVIHSSNIEFDVNLYPTILLKRLFAIAGEPVPSELVLAEDHVDTDYPRDQFDSLLKRAALNLEDGPI